MYNIILVLGILYDNLTHKCYMWNDHPNKSSKYIHTSSQYY